MNVKIPYFKPHINKKRFLSNVEKTIDSGHLVYGSVSSRFEDSTKQLLGCSDLTKALALNSCRAGLHLFLEATDVRGDYVIVPDITYTATAQAVEYAGAYPIFVECNRYGMMDWNNTLEVLRDPKYKGRIAAIIFVYYNGFTPEDMDVWYDLADDYGISLFEDAAHAFGATFNDGIKVGKYGHVSFSFYANKPLTTGEGGMILTSHSSYYDDMVTRSYDGAVRPAAGNKYDYEVFMLGYKYRMTDIAASLGLAQLKYVDKDREVRSNIANNYLLDLASCPYIAWMPAWGLDNPEDSETYVEGSTWHIFPVEFREGIDVEKLAYVLYHKYGVEVSRHYKPLSDHKYWGIHDRKIKDNEYWYNRLSLPIYQGLTKKDMDYVVESIKLAIKDCN